MPVPPGDTFPSLGDDIPSAGMMEMGIPTTMDLQCSRKRALVELEESHCSEGEEDRTAVLVYEHPAKHQKTSLAEEEEDQQEEEEGHQVSVEGAEEDETAAVPPAMCQDDEEEGQDDDACSTTYVTKAHEVGASSAEEEDEASVVEPGEEGAQEDWETKSTSSSAWGDESSGEESRSCDFIVSSIDRWFDEERREGRDVLTLIRQASMELGLPIGDLREDVEPDIQWRIARQAMISHFQRASKPTHRVKKEDVNTLDDVVELIQKSSKIMVLTGAGISVSCGIPDFRSENGIYNRLGEYNLPNPQCMFDIDYFRINPHPFFRFAKELLPGRFTPSVSHGFLSLLESKGKLLRNYSQNIDGLEKQAGMSASRLLQCHGSFDTATCLGCRKSYTLEEIQDDVEAQRLPMCEACGREDGVIKPDIVFFGEPLGDYFSRMFNADRHEADLCLVMGSSLKVGPVNKIIEWLPAGVPQILINREVVAQPNEFDVELLGDSDAIVMELCRRLGWELPEGLSRNEYGEAGKSFEFESPHRYLFVNAKRGRAETFSDDEEGHEIRDGDSEDEEDDVEERRVATESSSSSSSSWEESSEVEEEEEEEEEETTSFDGDEGKDYSFGEFLAEKEEEEQEQQQQTKSQWPSVGLASAVNPFERCEF